VSDTTAAGTGPLTVLSAGAAALARADTLDQALGVIVEAGAAAVGAGAAVPRRRRAGGAVCFSARTRFSRSHRARMRAT